MNIKQLTLFTLALIVGLVLGASPSQADTSAAGKWQYLIRRGDTKGVGGVLPKADCPFYVGYFNLDFYPLQETGKKKYDFDSRFDYAVRNPGEPLYGVGKESYEIKGSYTPVDDNAQCSAPLTQLQDERAPLRMTVIAKNGRKLGWYTNFKDGTGNANARWQVSAEYNGSDTINGVLKAYVCNDSENQDKCVLLNTAKFEAKRVKSFEEASAKPFFQDNSPLSTLMRWFSGLNSKKYFATGQSPALNEDEYSLISEEYTKSSLTAVFPASAMSPAFAASDIGLRICRSRGGTGSNPCKVCRNIDCQAGQQPSGPEKRVCCFGNNGDGTLCKTNCVNLWKCTTGGGQGPCI